MQPCNKNDRRAIASNIKSRPGGLEYGGSVSWLVNRMHASYLVEDSSSSFRFNAASWRGKFVIRFQSHGRVDANVLVGQEKMRSPGFATGTDGAKYRLRENDVANDCGNTVNGGCGYSDGYLIKVHDQATQSDKNIAQIISSSAGPANGKYSTPVISQASRLPGLALLNYRIEAKSVNAPLFSCKSGSSSGQCYTFYFGCTDCSTDLFHHQKYQPWGETEAGTFCMSWYANEAAAAADVFAVGPCGVRMEGIG